MDEFIQEVRDTTTSDLLTILQDQQELYSEEELNCIRDELETRSSIDISIGMNKMNRTFSSGYGPNESEEEEEDEDEAEEWLEMDEDDGLF